MNCRKWSAGIMLAGTVLVSRPTEGAQIDLPNLVVRIYPTSAVHPWDWKASTGEATAILNDAGIDVGWINCSETIAPMRCALPLKSNEVAIRIVRVPASGHHHDTLGESLLDPVRRTGTLATIYVDRVEWLAAAGGVEAGILMARAIAHELGHLLLGTTAHSRRGLMRRVWSRDELIRARAADWRFPAEDATRLQQALARRLEPAPDHVFVLNTH